MVLCGAKCRFQVLQERRRPHANPGRNTGRGEMGFHDAIPALVVRAVLGMGLNRRQFNDFPNTTALRRLNRTYFQLRLRGCGGANQKKGFHTLQTGIKRSVIGKIETARQRIIVPARITDKRNGCLAICTQLFKDKLADLSGNSRYSDHLRLALRERSCPTGSNRWPKRFATM